MFKRFTDGIFALGIVFGGFFAIFCMIWILGLNYCPEAPCNDNASQSEQPSNNKNWLPNSLWSDRGAEPHPANEDGHEDYYDHQDLAAQEIMAEATKWIVVLSGLSLVIGAVGAGAIIWTLLESRKVSNAAREANQIMRDDRRPWLRCEVERDGSPMQFRHKEGDYVTPIVVKITNVGKTPAKFLIFFEVTGLPTMMAVDPKENTHARGFSADSKLAKTIFPGETHTARSQVANKKETVTEFGAAAEGTMNFCGHFFAGVVYFGEGKAKRHSTVSISWFSRVDASKVSSSADWSTKFDLGNVGVDSAD
jgi:nitrogen fixation-related uncharacterized protein